LIRGDDLPVGVVGEVGADVGNATVIDVGVGRLAVLFSVLEHLFLKVESAAAQGADNDIGAYASVFGYVAHGVWDADVVGDVAHVVGELSSTAGNALRAEVAMDF